MMPVLEYQYITIQYNTLLYTVWKGRKLKIPLIVQEAVGLVGTILGE